VDAALAKALAKVPADRFSSAAAFARALAGAERPQTPQGHIWSRRGPVLAASLACVLGLVGIFASRRTPPAPGFTEPIRLAVLPFESVGDSGDRAFADGMSEEITNRLARIPGLTLMGRSSALRYPTSGQTASQFGRALGVGFVLDGTVRGATSPNGERRVRISPELIKVADGTHVWGEPYEGVLADVFELQGTVAERVAVALRGALGAGEQSLVRTVPTADVDAYRAYLLGRRALGTNWSDGKQAARHFEEAIAHDSNFARAYAGLAMASSLAWDFGDHTGSRDSAYAHARRAATRALALDSTLSEAHTALGWLLDANEWDWRAADVEFRHAVRLDPTDAAARHWYAMHLLGLGRTADALAQARIAVQLDPLTPLTANALGLALWFDGRTEEAIGTYRKVLDWDSTGSVVTNLLFVYMTAGLAEESADLLRTWPDASGEGAAMIAVTRARADPGLKPEALRLLQRLLAQRASGRAQAEAYGVIAGFYAELGDRSTALDLLERAEAAHEERLILLIKALPALASLHDEPRYRAIVRRMGLPE
jgi:serine/threonine-protein kinase